MALRALELPANGAQETRAFLPFGMLLGDSYCQLTVTAQWTPPKDELTPTNCFIIFLDERRRLGLAAWLGLALHKPSACASSGACQSPRRRRSSRKIMRTIVGVSRLLRSSIGSHRLVDNMNHQAASRAGGRRASPVRHWRAVKPRSAWHPVAGGRARLESAHPPGRQRGCDQRDHVHAPA